MAKVKDDYVFKLKGGEASTLECVNPFLERREPIVVFFENGQVNIKIGDGKNNYNNLPFVSDTNVDIGDVQGLTEILSQYEIDIENLNNKIDEIVIDKIYDPNSDNAQSGKAVSQAIAEMIGSAPETLDTLNELANALGDDPNFATTVLTKINEKPGEKTDLGGEIFNDYENNKAGLNGFAANINNKVRSNGSAAFGNGNTEGAGASVGANLMAGMENIIEDGSWGALLVSGYQNTIRKGAARSVITGQGNDVSGDSHIVGGSGNTLGGSYNLIGGYNNTIGNGSIGSLVLGHDNSLLGRGFIVGGEQNVVNASCGLVLGKQNTVHGETHFIQGIKNTVCTEGAPDKKQFNYVNGQNNYIEGKHNFIMGSNNRIEGFEGVAMYGSFLRAEANRQFIYGIANKRDAEALFIIANGDPHSEGEAYFRQKNAFVVKKDGTATLQNQGEDSNSIVIRSFVDDKIREVNDTIDNITQPDLSDYAKKEELVGKKTPEGGEIFNDYENNRAGSKAITFELGGYPNITEEYVSVPLIANATLEQGDMVSGKLVVTYGNTSNSPIKIESINQTNSEVTVIVTDIDVATAASKYLGVIVDCDICSSTHSTKVVAVKLEIIDGIPKATLTVDNTDGFVLGDNVSISINNAAENFGIIAAINNGLPVLTIPTYVANQIDIENLDVHKSFLRVVKKPDLGDLTIGEYSKASGSNTQALSNYAEASGKDTIASGEYSHAEGLGAFAGPFSHAEGFYTQANQMGTHSEGLQTIANGFASHTEGHQTVATGAYTHAEGSKTLAQEFCDHAEGVGTKTSGGASHAEGAETETDGYGAHAEGENSKALAQGAHAEGRFTEALAMGAHAEGNNSIAVGKGSHSEATSVAQGDNSHAEGSCEKVIYNGEGDPNPEGYKYHNKKYKFGAIGENSHAEGQNPMAVGKNSHAEGQRTLAIGLNSHSQGAYTYATGENSFSAGESTIAEYKNQFVIGQYNDKDTSKDALFVVGNGYKEGDESTRVNQNAFMVNKDGSVKIQKEIILTDKTTDKDYKIYIDNGKLQLEEVTN